MKNNQETSEVIKKDLSTLRMDDDTLEELTVEKVKHAYHKRAKQIHPDKVNTDDKEKVAETTAAFQEAWNSYQRILKYIIDKLQKQEDEDDSNDEDEEELATKYSFGKFNFPFENKGSFTVKVEDCLAELWQECLENTYGKPRIVMSSGTESDRFWKIPFEEIEITLHFYNHNKLKDKKQSKMLVQGSDQALICDFVFNQLPNIYKMVSSKRVAIQTPLRKSKRRRICTSAKKRNIRHKPASKQEELTCRLCDFKSVNNAKMTKHMKTLHTKAIRPIEVPRILVEDMSICSGSDDEGVAKKDENLLAEDKAGDNSDSVTIEEETSQNPNTEGHNKDVSLNTHTPDVEPPLTVKSISLYKCNECAFVATTTDNLLGHKKESHKKEVQSSDVFLHSCISCDYQTNDFSSLTSHIDSDHRPKEVVTSSFIIKCELCSFETTTNDGLKKHVNSKHKNPVESPANNDKTPSVSLQTGNQAELNKEDEGNKLDDIERVKTDVVSICSKCRFTGNVTEMNEHMDRAHKQKIVCEECGNSFVCEKTMLEHFQAKHVTLSSGEPFPCEMCGSVVATFELLQEHMSNHKTPRTIACKYCDVSSRDQKAFQEHMIESHEEYVILHTMAKQVDNLSDNSESFYSFKYDLFNTLKSLLENQVAMKQELFLIRNNHHNCSSKPNHNPGKPAHEEAVRVPSESGIDDVAAHTGAPARECSPSDPSRIASDTEKKPTNKPNSEEESKSRKTGKDDPVPRSLSTQKEKILFVGDSILHKANFRVLEKATNKTIYTAKAYAADFDTKTRKPNQNFKYVARNTARKRAFEYAVLQSPSVHITNLDTSDQSEEGINKMKEVARESSETMIKVAEDLIRANKSIKKVILLDCIPRLDHQLKSNIAVFSNNLNRECIAKSSVGNKMIAGAHTIAENEPNYGKFDSKADGIHMHGVKGNEMFTKSILNILSKQMSTFHIPRVIPPSMNKRSSPPGCPTTAPPMTATRPTTTTSSTGPSVVQFAVKTFNRFSAFLQ